jgi:hypothetical protein
MTSSTVHVAVFDTLADWETGYATAHIVRPSWQREPGRYGVTTVGPTRAPMTTMGGVRITPDLAVDELRPRDSAMLILAGVPLAAICGATFGLALEALLDERPHTRNATDYLGMSGYAGGEWFRDEPVVVDGNLITGTGVAPVHSAKAIFDVLGVYEPAVSASWFKLYGDRDPAGCHELMTV